MKRFQFRLERLLRVRRQQERLAEGRVQKARLQLDAARVRVSDLNTDLATAAQAVQGKLGETGPAAALLAAYEHSTRLGRALRVAEAEADRAAEEYRQAAAERTRLATEVEALQHLRSRAWDEYRYDNQLEEQNLLDEVGMRRWQAARAAGGFSSLAPEEKES